MSEKITSAPLEDEKAIHSQYEHAPELEHGDDPKKPKYAANTQLDDAARILAEAGEFEYTAAQAKRVLRKIDLYVCLPMCLTYFVQQLDKSSVSYAAVFNLQKETTPELVGSQYSWLTSVVYLAQFVCQPLSAYALIVVPVKYWVMFNYICWSVVTMCTGAATNFTGLILARFFLGCFEATILPSFVLITQMWWTRREQSYRTIAYQIANSMAAIIGPLLSYGVGRAAVTATSVKQYQVIFFAMGALSLFLAPIVWFLMPNSPTTAKFLRNGDDRIIALDRLKENNTGTKSSTFKWSQVWETYRDIKTWAWAAMWFCAACPSGGIGAFGGLITKGFGFDTFTSILMQIPTGAIGITGLLIGIYVTNRIKMRWPVLAVIVLFPIAGAIGLTQVPRTQPNALMGCYYVAFVFSCIQPLLISWCNLNAAGTTKRVVTTATMFAALTIGNTVGPQVYLASEAPQYPTGLYVDIGCWCVLELLIIWMGFYLARLNRSQEAKRVALGLPADIKDMSIMSTAEADAYKVELAEMMRRAGMDYGKATEGSFDDLTDRQNPHFQYVV
ncbi:major facilitator superfamily domain-containing protein [Dioszegia hungarica]|uniref:Major facilitator superfamily domain-containing protein n=1 Tax=Dioszegia hungarica TaxID=4972 RepID=A0AA38LRQ0_9TREE|nr:major facilitator superfamily domain-containing protein [Dioszegia hungarica]KAI9631709.1 major facilitator superfamily domain-containing protein [Dioszegia hungarica]